jgi:hypothetical protein
LRYRALLSASGALLALSIFASAPAAAEGGAPDNGAELARHEQPLPPAGPYLHFLGALALGRGLRLNNPYRLQTELGSTGQSLSLTASYADLSVAGLFLGNPDGLQHGLALHWSHALSGVAQDVVTPSYIALVRLPPRWLVYGRAGVPVVLNPDPTAGVELGAGGAWFASAGIGFTAELVGSLFYGAATEQEAVTVIPVVSLQVGVLVDYEVLP